MIDNPLLNRALQPLKRFYDRAGVEEVVINRPHEVWCKYHALSENNGWIAYESLEITYDYIKYLGQKLANISHRPFIVQQVPILSVTLPEGHRLQLVMGTYVKYQHFDREGMALAIRVFSPQKKVTEHDFVNSNNREEKEEVFKKLYSENEIEDLIHAAIKGEAILISGATASGKTSFLNALVEHIPYYYRIITLEDTREIMLPQPNRIHLLSSRTKDLLSLSEQDLLDAIMRLSPDIVLAGEISIKNAASIYRLITTGHTHFMATIHASSPEDALQAFYQNLIVHYPNLKYSYVMQVLKRNITRIVQLKRTGTSRVVSSIMIP